MSTMPEERLFELPEIKVVLDETQPNVVRLAFSGSVEFDRANDEQMKLYNGLVYGEQHELVVAVHVAGGQTRHRRDSEGYVDAVVGTKSLIVDDVYPVEPQEEEVG